MPEINQPAVAIDQTALAAFVARAGKNGTLISGAINTLAAQLKSLGAAQLLDQGTLSKLQGSLTALAQSTSATDATLQSLLHADAQTLGNLQTLIDTINGDGGASISQLLTTINVNTTAIGDANAAIAALQAQAAATQTLVESQIDAVEAAVTALTGALNVQATSVEAIDANANGTPDINEPAQAA